MGPNDAKGMYYNQYMLLNSVMDLRASITDGCLAKLFISDEQRNEIWKDGSENGFILYESIQRKKKRSRESNYDNSGFYRFQDLEY